MARWVRGGGLIGLALACEPIASLGVDDSAQVAEVPADGGTEGGASPGDDPGLFEAPSTAGQGGDRNDTPLVSGRQCSVSDPGEDQPGPIPVCCEVLPEERVWREKALFFINETRIAHGVEPLEPDAGLNSAAMGWVMHWSVLWDPEAKTGYPGRAYSPNQVARDCGTTASLLMATDAQDEPRLASGLIDPAFPASYWETDDNLSGPFLSPNFSRIGLATYDGLVVGILGQ